MPANIFYSPRANSEIQAFANGGWQPADINNLRQEIRNWVNAAYQNWREGSSEFRSIQARYTVSVYAELTDAQAGDVEVTQINI